MMKEKLVRLAAVAAVAAAPAANAQDVLTDAQMDRLTGGTILLAGVADAVASGVWTQTATGAQGVAARANGPHVFFEEMGVVSANAAANGSNLATQGNPAPTSTAQAATAGAADGSFVHNQAVYHEMSVGGITGVVTWRVIYSTVFLGI